jgi:hypothetical protein
VDDSVSRWVKLAALTALLLTVFGFQFSVGVLVAAQRPVFVVLVVVLVLGGSIKNWHTQVDRCALENHDPPASARGGSVVGV